MYNAKFDKILTISLNTSSYNRTHDPSIGCQIVSIGLIVADSTTFEPIAEYTSLIQYNAENRWEFTAQQIHGYTKEYLKEHGKLEEKVAEEISEFLYEHFGMEQAISCLGQNVAQFDVPFLKSMLHRYDAKFKFAARHVDLFSLAMPTLQTFSLEETFNFLDIPPKTRNDLVDGNNALKVVRIISKMWKKVYG